MTMEEENVVTNEEEVMVEPSCEEAIEGDAELTRVEPEYDEDEMSMQDGE